MRIELIMTFWSIALVKWNRAFYEDDAKGFSGKICVQEIQLAWEMRYLQNHVIIKMHKINFKKPQLPNPKYTNTIINQTLRLQFSLIKF